MNVLVILVAAPFLAAQPAIDLDAIRAEPQLEKRYWKALEYATAQFDSARKSYRDGAMEAYQPALDNVGKAVQLCDDTLRATGKNPSKSPKHFKRAELRMRELIRRLQGLEEEVGFDDRAPVAKVRARIQKIHDDLLLDIMGRRK